MADGTFPLTVSITCIWVTVNGMPLTVSMDADSAVATTTAVASRFTSRMSP
jgi:hypothetical protein